MDEPEITEMSSSRILETLHELKSKMLHSQNKSKYFFALGHAIRAYENYQSIKDKNTKLEFMIENGLGPEDMINDITYPPA
jgi:hypothetical protein